MYKKKLKNSGLNIHAFFVITRGQLFNRLKRAL